MAPDGALTAHYGGDTLNTAIHLARLGCDVAYATAIGCDEESDALLGAWQAEGIDTSLVGRHPDRRAGRYRIAVDSAGERSFSYERSHSAARDMFALEAYADWTGAVGEADCFVCSLISLAILPDGAREQVLELANRSRRTAYDGNYRPALWESADATLHWHERAIGRADIGLPTIEDEIALRGEGWSGAEADVAACWRDLGCGEVLVKAGADGCFVRCRRALSPARPRGRQHARPRGAPRRGRRRASGRVAVRGLLRRRGVVRRRAGFEFGEGALGAGDAVGGLVRGGYAGPVVFGARVALRFGGGLLADVGQVGFGGVGRRPRLGGAQVGVAGFGDVGRGRVRR